MKKQSFAMACVIAVFAFAASVQVMAADKINAPTISPSGILVKPDGSYLVTDSYNKVIWQIKDGKHTKAAGRDAPRGASDVPIGAYIDEVLDKASFVSPWGIAPFLNGYAVTDPNCNVVRFFDDKAVQTIVGTGKPGNVNANGIKAQFARPTGIAADDDGNLYVADTDNNLIKKIDKNGAVTTFAGSIEGNTDGKALTACFRQPTGLCYANGALYVADTGNHSIRMIKQDEVTTLAGRKFAEDTDEFHEGGYEDGDAKTAMFASPQGIAVDGGNVYVADTINAAIRLIKDGNVSTIFQNEDTSKNLYPAMPRALCINGNKLLVGDVFAKTIFTVDIIKAQAPIAPSSEELSVAASSNEEPIQNKAKLSPIWIVVAVIAIAMAAVTVMIIKKKK